MTVDYTELEARTLASVEQGGMMDPNELLKRLLANCKKMREMLDSGNPVASFLTSIEDSDGSIEDTDQIVEDFLNLDEWLRKGGFLPEDWNQTPSSPTGRIRG